MNSLNIAVAGASGRMGHMLIEAILQAEDAQFAGALDIEEAPSVGSDAAAFLGKPSGVTISSDLLSALANADNLIDLTRPEGTLKHLEYCAAHGIKMIIGTTGIAAAGQVAFAAAAQKSAIVFARYMSGGGIVSLMLLDMAAKSFAEGFDIEIIEAHHR